MMKQYFVMLLLLSITFGQIENYTGISTANESNPAWLINDYTSDFQNLGIEMNNGKGDFGLMYEPDKIFDINYIAKGEKQLFKNGIFSGFVAFHQQQLGHKMWVHNRNPYLGFPFLLADSSIGDMKLNGIHWQLGYSHKLLDDKLFLGSQLFYNVDEEIKDIFPKPIIKHRDMALSLGAGYKFNQYLQSGINYTYFDFQEQAKTSKYSQDQDKTPLIFKIRGLDNPIIFRGETSEERKQTFIGHNLKVDTKITDVIAKEITLLGEFETGEIEAVDGGSYPINQGTMDATKLAFFVDARFPLIGKSEIKFCTFGENRKYNADHPDLNIEVFEFKKEQLGGGLELIFPLNDHITFTPKAFGSSQFLKREDKFNGVLDYFPSTSFGGSLGIELVNYSKINQNMSVGYSTTKIGDSEIFAENTGWYYNEITAVEEIYYGTDSYTYWIDYHLNFQFKENRFVIFDIKYQSWNPVDNDYFDDYKDLSVGLKFEIRK